MAGTDHSNTEVDELLRLGSDRPPTVTGCSDTPPVDDRRLVAYRHGRLRAAEREALERHLIGCPYCRDFVAALEVSPPRPRWTYGLGVSAALAAALLLFVAAPAPIAPSAYAIAEVRGQIAVHRSTAPASGRSFDENSRVAIKVEPTGNRAAAALSVYRLEDGRLLPVAADVEQGEAGVFWVTGAASVLFGDRAGTKRLVMVATIGDEQPEVGGRELEDLREERGLTLLTFDARYRDPAK